LPIVGAMLTIPDLVGVLEEAPREAMRRSFLLGVAYGVGGTAFNVSIRYIGFSLTYAIAVGLSSVLGTLIPPLVKGQLGEILARPGAGWIMVGVAVGTLGIASCGFSGRLKETDLRDRNASAGFSLWRGLALSLLAGVLSAVYGFALEAGQPIADVAARHGAGQWEGNVIYIFSNSGAFLTTLVYTVFLGLRHRTLGEFTRLAPPASRSPSAPGSAVAPRSPADGGAGRASLGGNWLLAFLTGLFWYGQFFFYNLGHVRMTSKFTSWAIHMILLVLISNLVGVLFKEWHSVRPRTKAALALSLILLVAAVLLLTHGNQLGELPRS
jgi:L-rhamnose-H+ transport protein